MTKLRDIETSNRWFISISRVHIEHITRIINITMYCYSFFRKYNSLLEITRVGLVTLFINGLHHHSLLRYLRHLPFQLEFPHFPTTYYTYYMYINRYSVTNFGDIGRRPCVAFTVFTIWTGNKLHQLFWCYDKNCDYTNKNLKEHWK